MRARRPARRGDHADPSARLRVVLALPEAPEALPALMRAVDDPSPDVARAALARLPRLAGPGEAAYLRRRLLEVDLAVVRAWAAALRALGDEAAVPVAARGLTAPRPGTRMAAAVALGELRDPRAVTPLIHALADPIAGVRRSALDALALLGPEPRVREACGGRLFDRDAGVRCAAVHALSAVAIDADGWLRAALDDPSTRVRRELAGYVPSLRTGTAEMLLRDADADVRAAAAWALARHPRRDLFGALVALVGDDAWQVRHAGCRAAGLAGGREAAGALLPAIADPHPTVRAAALNVLADVCGDELAAVIADAITEAGGALRSALLHALARCRPGDAISILADQIDDPDRDVRLAAAVVLGGVGGEEAGRVLRVLLGDPDWNVRRAAEGALRRPARRAP